MFLDLPIELQFVIYRGLIPEYVSHSVVSMTKKPPLVSNIKQYLRNSSRKISAEYKISQSFPKQKTNFLRSVDQ